MSTLKRCESTITNMFDYHESKILVIANQGLKFYYVKFDDKNIITELLEIKPTQDLIDAYNTYMETK